MWIKKKNILNNFFRQKPHLKFFWKDVNSLVRLKSLLLNEIHELMKIENFFFIQSPVLTSFPLKHESFYIEVKIKLKKNKTNCIFLLN